MKKILLSAAAVAMLFASCGKDTETEYITVHDTVTVNKEVEKIVEKEVEKEKLVGYYTDSKPLLLQQGDTVIVNYGDIEVGADVEVYEQFSTILDPQKGKYNEYTLNCNALGAIKLKDGDDGLKVQDMENGLQNVTLINRGTITVHTKDLVEKYKDLIQTPENTTPKYKEFRVTTIFASKNSKVINEGVINVYFDHDPDNRSLIYVIGMNAALGSEVLNTGEINFYGTGSAYTRMRGVATFANNISIVNDGKITAKVDAAEDSRGITTGGTLSNVINNGTIDMTVPGVLYGITRYANNNITNNGTIKLTSVAAPEKYRLTSPKMCCGFYDPLNNKRSGYLSPMVNRGSILIDMQGAEENENRAGFGMCADVQANSTQEYISDSLSYVMENEGIVEVKSVDPAHIMVGEAGFFSSAPVAAATIQLGKWKTKLRDFATADDHLFLSYGGVNLNFGAGTIVLTAPDGYVSETAYSVAPGSLVFSATKPSNIIGYESLLFKTGTQGYSVVLDTENKTAALKKDTPLAK
jgi:hypothetical protein